MNDVPPKDRDFAMVFRNYALCPHMTAEETCPPDCGCGTCRRRRAGRVLNATTLRDLEAYLKRKPTALSGGQRQREAKPDSAKHCSAEGSLPAIRVNQVAGASG